MKHCIHRKWDCTHLKIRE